MSRLLSLAIVLLISFASASHAMPVAVLSHTQIGLTVPVGGIGGYTPDYCYDGSGNWVYCWGGLPTYTGYRGIRRGHYKSPNIGRYFHFDAGNDVIAVNRGFCKFGEYFSCNHGICWRFCN
jgi:hypothetical protein